MSRAVPPPEPRRAKSPGWPTTRNPSRWIPLTRWGLLLPSLGMTRTPATSAVACGTPLRLASVNAVSPAAARLSAHARGPSDERPRSATDRRREHEPGRLRPAPLDPARPRAVATRVAPAHPHGLPFLAAAWRDAPRRTRGRLSSRGGDPRRPAGRQRSRHRAEHRPRHGRRRRRVRAPATRPRRGARRPLRTPRRRRGGDRLPAPDRPSSWRGVQRRRRARGGAPPPPATLPIPPPPRPGPPGTGRTQWAGVPGQPRATGAPAP